MLSILEFKCSCESASFLKDLGALSNSLVAILTFVLAFYVFVYQRGREKEKDLNVEKLRGANIRLQWFKDLIITPKIHELEGFFRNLYLLEEKITTSSLDEDQKADLILYVKNEGVSLRKSFLVIIQNVEPKLFSELSTDVDYLVDSLTEAIADDELKLNNEKTYKKKIATPIQNAYNAIFQKIFSYEGN